MRKNNILNWIKLSSFIFALSSLFASCSNELDETLQPTGNGLLQFVVSDFPAFGESPDTRAIGTQDIGKDAWVKDDQIIVTLTSTKYGAQSAVLTYDGTSWSTAVSLSYLENETPTVSAIYAPCYEVTTAGKLQLKEGMQLGMTEYIPADCIFANGSVSIDFAGVTRTYSRLRIATTPGASFTVITTGFTPAGPNGTTAPYSYSLTADEKGNAFLYGVFAAGATVSVKLGNIEIVSRDFTGATEECVSYALAAVSPDVYDKTTNTYIVYTAAGLYAWNKKVQEIIAAAVLDDMGQPVYAEPFPNLTLEADIILTGENNWTPLGGNAITMDEYGFEYDYESYYNGVIDGKGHTITGLCINSNSEYQGFIGMLDYRATVKNLTFTDAVVSGGEYSGIVAGCSQGRIENCHVISGRLTATDNYAGGIVGHNVMGTVINCTNAATIAVAEGATDIYYVGGIAGQSRANGIIMGCINTGAISGYGITGGVVGENYSIVVACSNKGEVTATNRIGGIIGRIGGHSCQSIGSWTITTTESDTNGNGVGEDKGTITGCFTGDAATINSKVEEMNDAIATYNASAAEGNTCPYIWQVGVDAYPTLVEKSE